MSTKNRRRDSFIALGFFASGVIYYAFLIFHFLPRIQLAKYQTAAQLFRAGELPAERLTDFSPLYFALHLVFQNPLAIYWIHILALSAAGALFYLILRRFFRTSVAIAGTIVFFIDRSINSYAPIFEPEPLLILFMLTFVYFYLSVGTSGRDESRPYERRDVVLAGTFFALGLLCRPIFLPLLPFLPLLLKKRTFVFLLPVLCAFVILWLRNAVLLPQFTPLVMDPGTVFFEGNNPNSHGQSSIYPPLVNEIALQMGGVPDAQHEAYRVIARTIAKRNLSTSEVNSYWTSKALAYLQDHPRRTLELVRLKLFHTFHQYLWHDLANARENEKLLANRYWPTFPFAGISAAALFGMYLLRRQARLTGIFYLLFFCQLAGLLIFYVSARHHSVMVFAFLFFACATLEYLLGLPRAKAAITIAGLAALSVLFAWKTSLMREEDHLWEASRVSNSLLRTAATDRASGKLQEAAEFSAASLSAAPWYYESRRMANVSFQPDGYEMMAAKMKRAATPSEMFDAANLFLLAHQPEKAGAIFANLSDSGFELKRDFYQSSSLPFYISRSLPLQDKRRITILQDALKKSPGDPWILADLTVLTAMRQYSDQLHRYFDEIDAELFLGKGYFYFGKLAEASTCFSYVSQQLPQYRPAHLYLAASLGEQNKIEEGIREYRTAIRLGPDPLILEPQIIAIFRKAEQNNPNDPFTQYSYGIVLRQFGHFTDAMRAQHQALALLPGNSRIQSEIKALQESGNR